MWYYNPQLDLNQIYRGQHVASAHRLSRLSLCSRYEVRLSCHLCHIYHKGSSARLTSTFREGTTAWAHISMHWPVIKQTPWIRSPSQVYGRCPEAARVRVGTRDPPYEEESDVRMSLSSTRLTSTSRQQRSAPAAPLCVRCVLLPVANLLFGIIVSGNGHFGWETMWSVFDILCGTLLWG